MTKKKNKALKIFLILLGVTIADFYIPDPILLLDEILLLIITIIKGLDLLEEKL
ncbi:MAG: hypothetical protein AABY22_19350 [Nanoarchaeota archaeon]